VYACGGCTPNYGAIYTGNPNACANGQSYCDGYCVNGDTCGDTCPYNGVCDQGACACPDGASLCNYGPYNSYCSDFNADRYNCGGCGIACDIGTECAAGSCEPVVCTDIFTLCGSSCVDLSSDQLACGGCTPYYEAVYTGNPNLCQDSQTYCDGYCVNGTTCGKACEGGTCAQGACACSDGLSLCSGGEFYSYCADLTSDRYNCGGCQIFCDDSSQCVSGSCEPCAD
jgi:hypothetical protein